MEEINKAIAKYSIRINEKWKPESANTWESFLKSDLSDSIIATSLIKFKPESFSIETIRVDIEGPLLVQVISIEDIGKPKYKVMKDVKEEGLECGGYLEGVEKEEKAESEPKMLKIGFKSAYGNFFGLEMERISLFLPEMEMGMKLILKPPFIIRRGIALLLNKNCEVLKTLTQLTKRRS